MFEQTFKNMDDVLRKEAGCTTELDYTEQTSWLLFLKYLDDLEAGRAMEADLVGKPYAYIAFALPPVTCRERAEARKARIFSHYDAKLQAFLDFVLSRYIKEGVGELDGEKLPQLLQLKYRGGQRRSGGAGRGCKDTRRFCRLSGPSLRPVIARKAGASFLQAPA